MAPKPTPIALAALSLLFVATTQAQTPTPQEAARQGAEMSHYAICRMYGCDGSGGAGPRVGYDPCYLAQNAMVPCSSERTRASQPVGVDPHAAGTWELPFKEGPWVLEIHRDGTYRFHSEAGDGVPPNTGKFSASEGHWSLKVATGETDGGSYLYQAPDIWIATGKLGAAAWRRTAADQDAVHLCTPEQRQVSNPVGVDPHLVGTWQLPLKGGAWVWEILRDGAYKFHSEAGDGAPSHSGRVTASNGRWSLTASSGYTDAGFYLYQAPDILMATGRLGAGAWRRPASRALPCSKKPGDRQKASPSR